MQLKRTLEHLLLPEVFIGDPVLLVDLLLDDCVKGTYGLYQASLHDLDLGVLFRVVLLSGCHLLETEVLRQWRAEVWYDGERLNLNFDEKHFGYTPA